MDLQSYEEKLDEAVAGILELWEDPAHRDKRHYRFPGHSVPLSVTGEEGRILFAIARVIQPGTIFEAGTGTGISAACLAAGWPSARVVTVDNFSEGNIGPAAGAAAVKTLWSRLGLRNIELKVADIGQAAEACDLLFLDGTGKGAVPAAITQGARLVIEHDDKNSRHRAFRRVLGTPCYLSLHADDQAFLGHCERIASVFL